MELEAVSSKKVNWMEVIVFYVIAVAVSAPFRTNLVNINEVLPLPEGLGIFYRLLRGVGPAIGFIVMYKVFKSPDAMKFSFSGINRRYSLMAMLVIPVGITLAGVDNEWGLEKNYYGLLTGLMLFGYAILEEYGWRGYLQQALSPLPLPVRILTIAVLWYIWHLNFFVSEISPTSHIIFFLLLILGSWGLMKISETTHSILFTAGVHLSFNLLSDVHVELKSKLFILGAAIVVWIILIRSILSDQRETV
jgi:membrane protease YdiL (CAAX protease family)